MELAGLLAGLGNPGRQYEGTRHNCGFGVVDDILADCQKDCSVENLGGQKFFCELWRAQIAGQTWLLAKPQTFMNDSGKSVQALLSWFKLDPGQLVVAHDELDIPCGELRFKFGGGNAGHNGLRSIEKYIGGNAYYRLRVGIGKPAFKGDMLAWVLGRPDKTDTEKLDRAFREGADVFYAFMKDGLKEAANMAKKFGKSVKESAEGEKK